MDTATVSKWGNAPNVVKSFTIDPSTYGVGIGPNGVPSLESNTFPILGANSFQERNCYEDYYKAYRDCAPLASIINKLATSAVNGNIEIYRTNGKGKDGLATRSEAEKIRSLIRNPNPIQTEQEFRMQGEIYKKVFGFNLVYVLRPVGYQNYDAAEIWNIPLNLVSIKLKQRSFIYQKDSPIESITLTYGGQVIPLPVDNCYLQKDITPSFNTMVLPESRIRGLSQQIHNIQLAYSSRGSIIEDRGALGIISSAKTDSSGQVSLTPVEKKNLQNDFKQYGLNRGKFKYIITNVALTWQSIGFSTKDLMLFEEINDDVMKLCDGYGFPYRLVSSEKSASYNDVREFQKHLYQDTVIPESDTTEAFWNTLFSTSTYSITIDIDYSDIPILQEDTVNKANARYKFGQALLLEFEAGLATLNDWLYSIGRDASTRPEFDMYYPEYEQWHIDTYGKPPSLLSGKTASQLTTQETNNQTTTNEAGQ